MQWKIAILVKHALSEQYKIKEMLTKKLNTYQFTIRQLFSFAGLLVMLAFLGCNKDDNDQLIEDTGLCLVEVNGVFEEIELDEMPVYSRGSQKDFYEDIIKEIYYPVEARDNDIQGVCIINYEVTQQGTVENIEAVQDPGGGIGNSAEEAVEEVTVGTSFSPGILNGVPVRVKKEIRIRYKLE
jgi:hypothetical protein